MPRDYDQTARALIEGAEKAVAKAVAPLLKRIEELEARKPERGEPGEKGDAGERGADGADGLSVKTMLIDRSGHLRCVMADGSDHDLGLVVGKDGQRGERGEDGAPGADGKDGRDGTDGADGEPGQDGKDGENGTDGRDGIDGKDGVDGKDGADGSTPQVDFTQDGDIGMLSFVSGEARKEFEIKLPYTGQARGLYDAEASYRALDVVSLNGSEWRAKSDNPGPLPGDGWMLSAQRGRRGEQGQRGQAGSEGKAGKDGSSIIQLKFEPDTAQLLAVMDSGEVFELDFDPIIRAIRGEE